MSWLLIFVIVVYLFMFCKALGRLALCNFSIKLFMSESTYAWMGGFFLFNVAMVIIAVFGFVIKLMVEATL